MILITGASGFLGSHIVKKLAQQNVQILGCYHHHIPEFKADNVKYVKIDLNDITAIEKLFKDYTFSYIINSAASISFSPKEANEIIESNTKICSNLVNYSLSKKGLRFIHVSSVAALGRTSKNEQINEHAEWIDSSENSNYAKSKYYSEMEIWRGVAEGLDAMVFYPSIIIGDANPESFSGKFVLNAVRENKFYTSGANAFVDVEDVAEAIHTAMQNWISNAKFILSQGNYAYQDIFSKLAIFMGKRKASIKVNSFWVEIYWRIEYIKELIFGIKPLITKETARAAIRTYQYDNSKFLNFYPHFKYTPMDNTLKRIGEKYLNK